MKKERYNITGMTCSSCSARIEKVVARLEGISEATVNLLTNTLDVTYDENKLSCDLIISKIKNIGFGASVATVKKEKQATGDSQADELTQHIKLLIISAAFTIPLFYLSMGGMLNLPLPAIFLSADSAMTVALTQFLLVVPVTLAQHKYFKHGFKNLIKRVPNMDSLISIGSSAAIVYGIIAMYKIGIHLSNGEIDNAYHLSQHLYFESAAMILTLISLGKYFELHAKKRTGDAIYKLMSLTPGVATLLTDDIESQILTDQIAVGNLIVVKDGESIAVDGVIINGSCFIDESTITGESLPAERIIGDKVIGGTIVKSGYIIFRVTAVGENTSLAKIIRLVENATATKAPIARLADKISGIFVPIVMSVSLISFITWLVLGKDIEFCLTVSISVLVISCPCALGLATPAAIMVATGRGAASGILIKSATALETACNIDVIMLDKTGTITEGSPKITELIPINTDEKSLLQIAASLEKNTSHPLGRPIVDAAKELGLDLFEVQNFEYLQGLGIVAKISGKTYYAGNKKLMQSKNIDTIHVDEKTDALAKQGKTPLYFADDAILGIISVADSIKQSSNSAISQLLNMGMDVIMLTGDNKHTAKTIAEQAGISSFTAEALPEDKEQAVIRLQLEGKKVAMVGDGINDSPALARADIGIAIGNGTDIAIDSADIVLMKSDLNDVATAIRLSKACIRTIKLNLFWAFFYNALGIPIAAGLLYAAFGILLSPMIAAAAMSFSSVSVVLNALLLKFFKPKKLKQPIKLADITTSDK